MRPELRHLLFAPIRHFWTPANITTALWLDAADVATLTEVNGRISQWSDKSGNARHATQATAAQRPKKTENSLNNCSVVEFDPSSNSYQHLAFSRLTSIGHVFFVAKKNNVDDRNVVISDGTTNDLRSVFLGEGTGSVYRAQQITGSLSTATRNSWHIAEIRTDGVNASLGIDGTRTTNADVDLMSSSQIGLYAGQTNSAVTSQYSFSGQMAEIIMTATALSDSVRQIVEGYLARKWGLTANLPSDHPYKTSPPLV